MVQAKGARIRHSEQRTASYSSSCLFLQLNGEELLRVYVVFSSEQVLVARYRGERSERTRRYTGLYEGLLYAKKLRAVPC